MLSTADLDRALNPFPWYATMRETAPVHYSPNRGVWNVFRYDDVQRVLSDYAAFSSERYSGGTDTSDAPLAVSVISTDPPRHRQLRNLVTQAFTPRAVARLEPRIAALTTELLDTVAPSGEMDVIADFAYPLPVIVIAEMLGIPVEDRPQFKRWSDGIVHGTQGGTDSEGRPMGNPNREMAAYFREMVAQRRKHPGEDLISGLLEAEVGGERLTETELLGFCMILLIAGHETTTNLLGNAVLTFDEHPEAWRQLREQPDLLPNAIEEVLRYRSPVQSMIRTVKVDTELHGEHLRAGQPVLAWIGSANTDPAQFPAPERFDISRTPNRHIAFGHGIHFCLGAPLARLEGRIALGELLRRMPDLRRVPDSRLEPLGGLLVYGVRSLPVTFTAARAA